MKWDERAADGPEYLSVPGLGVDRKSEGEIVIFRGSRKHVLDWISQPGFSVELLQLVQPVDVRISSRSKWMPRGYDSTDEARLETFGPQFLPKNPAWKALREWWLCHENGANTPNWDIAVGCEIDGCPGIVLVEAKANVPELSAAGKQLDIKASENSKKNHIQIGEAIDEVRLKLREINGKTSITRDSHYQLSNRVAFAWKLASLGIPTVLVYLGFCGDAGIIDAGAPFKDDAHWTEVFNEYSRGLVPAELFERRIDCGAASTWFLVRSRSVIEISPSARQ